MHLFTPKRAGIVCVAMFTVVGICPGKTILRCTEIRKPGILVAETTYQYQTPVFQTAALRSGEELFDKFPIVFGAERRLQKVELRGQYAALITITPDHDAPFIQVMAKASEFAKLEAKKDSPKSEWQQRVRHHPQAILTAQFKSEKKKGNSQQIVNFAFSQFQDPIAELKNAKWGLFNKGVYRSLETFPLLPRPYKG